jgi:ubiquinone/menaquinone biosynthesis C-methylase UbiE
MHFSKSCSRDKKRENLWRKHLIATAYSYQQSSRPYLELLKATESFIKPRDGEMWLDIGCGSGRLIRSIWEMSRGRSKIIGTDLSLTALKVAKRCFQLSLSSDWEERIQLVQSNFSDGLGTLFRPRSFDGITAGLCIGYADHWDPVGQRWDNKAYVQLLKDMYTLLKDNGTFVFSSNVPGYSYWLLALKSWREIILTWKLPLAVFVSAVMLVQSRWLRQNVNIGRFHYLQAEEIVALLQSVGFKNTSYQLSYAQQAWVFCTFK